MQEITKRMYQKAILDFSKKYSRNTVSAFHITAKIIFKEATELGIIKINPTSFIKIPKENLSIEELEIKNSLPKFLEKEQLLKFLDTVKKHSRFEDYVVFYVLAFTGIRISELGGLLWDAVDFKENKLNIKRNLFYGSVANKKYELTTPKTSKSVRIIDVDNKLIELLKEHQKNQNIEKMKNRQTWNTKHDFIFTSKKLKGFPLFVHIFYMKMKRILKIASLPEHFTPHSLRHTHTSLLAAAGRDLYEIMERLGHSNDLTTRDIYLHMTAEKKKDVAKAFSDYLGI